ncbi:terminase large subunit [Nocardia salmonicida]|uniref:terminase large subunit n=1 Tax=Nocardia salmonicida TaxID=53431 RepID=UPI002E2CC303|nr:terminase TerL endonuclease subunit [Nocardia salmonicida]
MTRTTRSSRAGPHDVELPDAAELDRLKLSPEVAWYLLSRGIPLPDCPPRWKTPEPRDQPGARFDPDRVDRVLNTFRNLRHTKGRLAGRPLIPDPWQVAYVIAPAFGWVHLDEDLGIYVRIARTIYVELPRKNGKSTLAGGIGIYLTCADGEEGAQVIAAATRLEQAAFVFAPIKQLAERSPALAKHVKPYKAKIVHSRTGSYFQPVASAGDAQHGADLHGGIVDELHLHRTNDLVEAIETGTGSRSQPLILFITTADASRKETPYDRKRTLVEQLARGALTDPSVYGVIWAADPEADPYAEETQRSANPGFGISPTRAYLRSAATRAAQSPADHASYLRLHLGIRTKQETRFLDIAAWDRNAAIVDESRLVGRLCYGGLDLASTSDLTALCWLFPDDDGGFDALWRLWVPEAAVASLDRRTAKAASLWVKRGILNVTPGEVADYGYIRRTIGEDGAKFDVAEIAYDRWNSSQLVNDLVSDGAPMVTMGQGYASMSAPTKQLQRLILLGTEEKPVIRHGGNPAVRWTIDNFAISMDPAGNVKPDKKNAADKIDPGVALIMALGRAIESEPPQESAYEHDGLLVV